MAVYVLIAIIKKKLGLQQNLYTILQVLSLTLFEKNSILSLFENSDDTEKIHPVTNCFYSKIYRTAVIANN